MNRDTAYWQQRATIAEGMLTSTRADLTAHRDRLVALGRSLEQLTASVATLEDLVNGQEHDTRTMEHDLALAVQEAHSARQSLAASHTALADARATIDALRDAQAATAALVHACAPLRHFDRPPTKTELTLIRRAARELALRDGSQ